MSAGVVLAAPFGLPDPFGLMGGLVDGLLGVGGGVLNNVVEDAVRWLVDATLRALVELATAILGFFWDAAEPDVTAGWFAGGRTTPYGEMVVLAAPLIVAFFLAGIIQGVVRGDTAGMVQMAVMRLPGAVLAMTVVIALTDLLLRATDEMSDAVLGGFRDDVETTTRLLGQVAASPGLASGGQLLLLVFGGVGLLAAVVLVIELFVRAGLTYIVVALSPLIYAAAVWEQLRGGVRKLAELGLALIISKFVIAVALSLSAAALVAAWPGDAGGGEIATPEMAAGAGGGPDGAGAAQTIGLLVGAVVMFGVAAFMPFVLFRLLPMAEAAMVSQGIKAGPMRAAQQAHHTALIARHNPATAASRRHRHQPGASGAVGGGSGAGAASAGAGGGGAATGSGGAAGAAGTGAAAGAAGGPAGAVVGAAVAGGKAAVKAGARRTAAAADRATSNSTPSSPSGSGSPGRSEGKGVVRQVRWGATGPGTGLQPPGSAGPASSPAQRSSAAPPRQPRGGRGGGRS